MYPIWFLDHYYLVTFLIITVLVLGTYFLYWYYRRVSEQHPVKAQFALYVGQLINIVLVTFLLNNLYVSVRDREQRQWALRQNHLVKLQTVLRVDSEKLTSVARQARNVGRISGFSYGPATDMVELESYFSPDVLTPDLANHYQEYWQEKQQLLRDVQRQDGEFGDTIDQVSEPLHLPSHAEKQRVLVGRAYLAKCLGKEPGITHGDRYRIFGNDFGDGPDGMPAILEAFQSISPTAETIKHCEALKKGAMSIAAKATELSLMANRLAERTVLTGDCEYTKLD